MNRIRATARVLDDGRIYAEPGDTGEVLASETLPGGTVALTVAFPGVRGVTTVYLGQDVEPVLAVVGAPPELAPAPRRRSRWPLAVGGAVAAALLAWLAPSTETAPELVPALASEPVTVDTARTAEGSLFAGKVPTEVPKGWKRAPCERTQVEVNGACFLSLEQRPPCRDGYEHQGRCLVPIVAPERTPSSVRQ